MDNYILERVYLPTETLGSIYAPDGSLVCKTMELAWKDNKRSISCIPEGAYKVIKQPPKEDRDYSYFRLPNVPGRSGILIHRITYVKDLKGCIGTGSRHLDLNKDGVPDMVESGKKLQWMVDNLPDQFTLTIRKK
jgi:Family of unknown function (DUF5675)